MSSSCAAYSSSSAIATMCSSITEQFAAISLSDQQKIVTASTTSQQQLETLATSCLKTFILQKNFDTVFREQIASNPGALLTHFTPVKTNDPFSLIFCTAIKYITSHHGPKNKRVKALLTAIQPLVNPQYRDKNKRTCLNFAIFSEKKEFVLNFCKNGALLALDKEQMRISVRMLVRHFEQSFLHKLVSRKDLSNDKTGLLLSILIEEEEPDLAISLTKKVQQCCPNWWQQFFRSSLFALACHEKSEKFAAFMIPYIDPNERCSAKGEEGSLPLAHVAKNGWAECINMLVKRGADCNLKDSGKSIYEIIEEGRLENE